MRCYINDNIQITVYGPDWCWRVLLLCVSLWWAWQLKEAWHRSTATCNIHGQTDINVMKFSILCGLGSTVCIATGYGLEGPGIESWWRQSFPHLSRPALEPSQWVPGSFLAVKSSWGMMLTFHPLLVPRSRKSRAIPLLLLWAVQPVQSLSACTRVHFTPFFFNSVTIT